jgi:dihydroflavonol-4-reductase
LAKAFDEGIEGVFHLAAVMTTRLQDSHLLHEVNVRGTGNVVRLCEEKKVARLVHVSSSVTIGGSDRPEVLNEDSVDPLRQEKLDNYESKRKGEELVLAAARDGKVSAVVVNPGLMFGAGDGKKPIRRAYVQVARGQLPFFTPGGINVVAVEDVVEGMIAAFEKGRSGERYLLTGENLTLKQVFEMIAREAGVKAPQKEISRRVLTAAAGFARVFGLQGDFNAQNLRMAQLYHWYDHSKATRELGFHPRPASEAIRNSVQWILKNDIGK